MLLYSNHNNSDDSDSAVKDNSQLIRTLPLTLLRGSSHCFIMQSGDLCCRYSYPRNNTCRLTHAAIQQNQNQNDFQYIGSYFLCFITVYKLCIFFSSIIWCLVYGEQQPLNNFRWKLLNIYKYIFYKTNYTSVAQLVCETCIYNKSEIRHARQPIQRPIWLRRSTLNPS